MKKKYTNKDIKNALKQAKANIEFEDINVQPLKKYDSKILRKELKNDQRRGFN